MAKRKRQSVGPKPKPHLLAIPTLDGRVPHQILELACQVTAMGHMVLTVPAHYPREWAKNRCVQTFLSGNHDRLLICDGDMTPSIEAWDSVMALLDDGFDAAVARCLIGKKDAGAYAPMPAIYELAEDRYQPVDKAGEVDGIGGAFTAYTRRLLADERLWVAERSVFRNVLEPDGRISWSEDLDFCYRAKELGYRFAASPERVGHLKTVDLDLVENSIEQARRG